MRAKITSVGLKMGVKVFSDSFSHFYRTVATKKHASIGLEVAQ